MKKTIKGNFEVNGTPESGDETTQSIGAMRMKFEKKFEGPLNARGTVSMMGILDRTTNSGGYVAIERITGTLDERKGSFCLQHSCTMAQGKQDQIITVIPDTGTEELKGLCGKMIIDIAKDGQHFYTFEYELE